MLEKNPLLVLVKYILPEELLDNFELVDVIEEDQVLYLHLDELEIKPESYKDIELFSNGFYEKSTIKDFPLRDKKVILHVRRRRWKDALGKSYSQEYDLTAQGTRYSKEFARALKKAFGYIPDSSPIS